MRQRLSTRAGVVGFVPPGTWQTTSGSAARPEKAARVSFAAAFLEAAAAGASAVEAGRSTGRRLELSVGKKTPGARSRAVPAEDTIASVVAPLANAAAIPGVNIRMP
jgi:hypothetical protein